MNSLGALGALLVAAMAIALIGPLHYLLIIDLGVTPFHAPWHLFGVQFDQSDVLLFCLFFGIVIRRPDRLRNLLREMPYRKLWMLMVALVVASFFVTPFWSGGQPLDRDLSNPLAAAYQIYRYHHLHQLLYFVVAVMVLGGHKRFPGFSPAIIAMGDLVAGLGVLDTWQTGARAEGPFTSPNQLGAALIVPFLLSLAGVVNPRSRRQRLFCLASLLLIGRGLMYTSSRGAFAGVLVGALVLVWRMSRRRVERNRLLRLAPMMLLAMALVFVLVPDVLERPNVQRLMGLASPYETRTFQWRLTERWGYYYDEVLENPWLGTGLDFDPKFEGWAKTPHNSYLSLGMLYGVPFALLYPLLALLAIRRAMVCQAVATDEHSRFCSLAVIAALSALLVHGMVDGVLLDSLVNKLFWILVAVGGSLPTSVRSAQLVAKSRRISGPQTSLAATPQQGS